jgi:replicative DNA helicase
MTDEQDIEQLLNEERTKMKAGGRLNGSTAPPDWPEPPMPTDNPFQGAPRSGSRQKPTPAPTLPRSLTMEDLMNDDSIAVPELMVEGLLPRRGIALLGGRPKDGKSWFGCQIALSVVTGQSLGGWLRVRHPGRVQLWALEDQFAITKDKLQKLLPGGALPDGSDDLRVFDELPQPILHGGDNLLRAALKAHPAELVILDSLFKLSGAPKAQGDISQRDYDLIERVRKIALDFNCCALIIMHTKKGSQGGNPIENLLGTSGTPAAADAIAELKRYREGGKLTVVGRSVAMDDYELVWHGGPDQWGWSIQDQGEQAGLGETSEEVLAYLEAQGATKPAQIAGALHKSFSSVWNALLRLQQKKKAIKCADKKWDVVR